MKNKMETVIKTDEQNRIIYKEDNNCWEKWEWDTSNHCIFYETSKGYFITKSYEKDGSVIVHYESEKGYIEDFIYNKDHKIIYYTNNRGAEVEIS